MQKIIRVSRFLKWAALIALAVLPMFEAGYWVMNGYPLLAPFVKPLPQFGSLPIGWGDLSENQRLFSFVANLLPILFWMAAIAYFGQLFAAFEKLKLFERTNARLLKRAGWAIVLSQVAVTVCHSCLSLILTSHNPVGERVFAIGFSAMQLEVLLIGLAVMLISWILEEAGKMQEEQAATV